ncbi:cytochrome P450 [Aspergillus stella-maris]|uniref:cytochrome P450 n=1 Tax=Aspergillus stella-maris TaxID=1810926 RepID=UPI003CCE0300
MLKDNLVPFAAALVILYGVLRVLYLRHIHPYSKYPGPFLASVSRIWLAQQVIRGRVHKTQRELHQQHGDIIRIAPDEISMSNPAAMQDIYARNQLLKTDFYMPWRPSFAQSPDLFTATNPGEHTKRKRLVNNIYSMRSILESETLIDSCTEEFMSRMEGFMETHQPIDLALWVQWYAFDVIGELYFSSKFGFMREQSDVQGFIGSLDTLLPGMCAASVLPKYARPLFLSTGMFFKPARNALRALKKIEEAAATCVRDRLSSFIRGGAARHDILNKLLILHKRNAPGVFTIMDVQTEIHVGLLAGSDTTAAAISAILFYLIKHQDFYEKLQTEIDNATSLGELTYPRIKYTEAIKLPYLVACCKEGMRMHPSVGMTLPRVVPPHGTSINGQWFQGGCQVGMNASVIHFDKQIFGDDADVYNPERWLKGNSTLMDRYMFQFGGGSRTCIGKNIALCEIYKLVPDFLRTYDISLVDANSQWQTRNHWFNKPLSIPVRIHRRSGQKS